MYGGSGEQDDAEERDAEGGGVFFGKQLEEVAARSPDVKTIKANINHNMGHRRNHMRLMVLKYGRAKKRYLIAADLLERGPCDRMQAPQIALQSRTPMTYEFNTALGTDIIDVEGLPGEPQQHVLNMLCGGTGHPIVVPVKDGAGETLKRA